MILPWLLLNTPALAGGLDTPAVAPLGSGVTTADAAAAWFNPAMLGGLEHPELLVGVGLAAGRIGYARERRGAYPWEDGLVLAAPVDPADLDPSRTGPAAPVEAILVSPLGDLFLGGPVWRDRLFLGGSLTVPYAAPVRWPGDGAQRWALQEAQIFAPHATLSIAAVPHPAIHLGAGVSYVLGIASLARVQDFAGLDLLGDALERPPVNQPNDLGADAPSELREQAVLARPFVFRDGLAHGVSFSAGLAAYPHQRVWLAASYEHGTPLRFDGRFHLDLDDPFFTDDLAANGLAFAPRVEGDATLSFRLPHRIRAGVGVKLTPFVRLDVLAEGVLWSVVDAFALDLRSADLAQPELGIPDHASAAVPRRWTDAVNVSARVGAMVRGGTVLAELGWQTPASPDATVDAASPDGHALVVGLGGTLLAKERLRIHLDGRLRAMLPREVTRSDHDLANGRYDLVLGALTLHVQARLDRRAPARHHHPAPPPPEEDDRPLALPEP